MAFSMFIPKEHVEIQYKLLKALEEKCSACKLFDGFTPDYGYIYREFTTPSDCKVAIVYVKYNSCRTYAVYSPETLTGKDLAIFKSFLYKEIKYAEPDEQIVVFSQKDYDAIMKYNYGKPINVKLYV